MLGSVMKKWIHRKLDATLIITMNDSGIHGLTK